MDKLQDFKKRIESKTYTGFEIKNSTLITDQGYKVQITFELSGVTMTTNDPINIISFCITASKDNRVVDRWGNDPDSLGWYRSFYYQQRNRIGIEQDKAQDSIKAEWLK